ncbi:hypothetical protein ACFL5V_05335 [Fibrobacterota bacterium]
MIKSFFLGNSESIGIKLQDCYKKIRESDPELNIQFSAIKKHEWKANLPNESRILIFYEVTDTPKIEIDTIHEIQDYNSDLQLVLLADPDIDYYEIAATYKIGNILKKNLFDHSVIRALTVRLMTGNLLGFKPYFPHGYEVGPLDKTVEGTFVIKDLMEFFEAEFLKYVGTSNRYRLRTYFYELLINTISYTVVGITSQKRDAGSYSIPPEIHVPEGKFFKISMAMDKEKCGFSILDTSGTLSLSRVLQKLRRQSIIGEEKHPPGMWDLTGRGLSLVLKDNRMIINIIQNAMTEIIFMHYKKKELNKYESVIITEISSL